MKVKISSVVKKFIAVILALLAIAGTFGAGFFIGRYKFDPSLRTIDWVKKMVQTYYYQEITDEQFVNASLSSIFGDGESSLLDAYSAYYSPKNYQDQVNTMAGNRTGAGLTYWMKDDQTIIYRVFGNSAAEKSGLCPGMHLLGYGMDAEHITYGGYSAEFSTFMSNMEDGQPYVLLASTAQGEEGTVYELCNTPYRQNYVFYYDSETSYRFTGEQALTPTEFKSSYNFLPQNSALIRLDSFMGDAAAQMQKALQIFKERGRKKLLLDLRNNGGGDMAILTNICQYFCKEAPMSEFVITKCDYRGSTSGAFRAKKNAFYDYFTDDVEISVLANDKTASASECFLGAMIDYNTIRPNNVYLAEYNGVAKTYGKGIMQTTYVNQFTQEAVKLTTATLHWPLSNKCIHGVGFLPSDGAVAITCYAWSEYRDSMVKTVACA